MRKSFELRWFALPSRPLVRRMEIHDRLKPHALKADYIPEGPIQPGGQVPEKEIEIELFPVTGSTCNFGVPGTIPQIGTFIKSVSSEHPMKKMMLIFLLFLVGLYIFVCILLYCFQEHLIFAPKRLERGYKYAFQQPFEEINIPMKDSTLLNGLLFKTDNSKGLIFYLHGNAGSLDSWGPVAKTYTDLKYDVFILDYRGYGKSEGAIKSQTEFFEDVQTVYDSLKKRYPEEKMIILGYSIGSGPACRIASANNARLLILQAPFYSLTDMMRHRYPFIPTFLLKYKFQTNTYLPNCKMPVVIFHGDQDEIIYYGSSVKLGEKFRNGDTLITLHGQGHNGITENPEYKMQIGKILSNPDPPVRLPSPN